MPPSEVIDCVTHIKVIGIGAEGRALASNVPPRAPHVRVLSLPQQAPDETLQQMLADTHLLFIATDITDAHNQRHVERVLRVARAQEMLVVGVAVLSTYHARQAMLETWYAHVDALLVGEPCQLELQLRNAVHEVSAIVDEYGHVNVDFEDVRTILSMQGIARVGTGTAAGIYRAQRAALDAIQDIDLTQAQGLLMLLSAAKGNLRLSESRQAMHMANTHLPDSAHVIFGAAYDDSLGDQIRVTVLVSGLPYSGSANKQLHAG